MRVRSFIVVAVVLLGQWFGAVPPECGKCPVRLRCCSGKVCTMRTPGASSCGMSAQAPSAQREVVQVLDLAFRVRAFPPFDVVRELRDVRASRTSPGFPRLFEEPPRFILVRV